MTTDTRTSYINPTVFARANRITMRAERTGRNPFMSDSRDMDHWRVTMQQGRRQFTTYFSMGFGHNGKAPKVGEVLDCLASDAAESEGTSSFEDWCSDLGYDPDSRKAEATYQAIGRQAARLRRFLGDDAYADLLWHTER